ncbi:hypothetical protein [Pseudooceanicola onchidii]|uniref:hypothetical protein n=1 Tax=Pseudooceanicola onchidii TaxID=2562279 RepID=UPI0010A9CB57|nr:hypothetical protein [Pseudooceanicola onchidii]
MEKLDQLSTMIADEIMSAPEQSRADMALQIASSFVELSGYEMARSGTVKSSTRLFLLANEIERLRRAERDAAISDNTVVPFVPRASTQWATA